MRKAIICVTTASLVLAGCSGVRDSRLNPFNWFGRSEPVAADTSEDVNPLIPRSTGISLFENNRETPDTTTPISTVLDLTVERVPGGAIVRAKGIDPRQGAFNVNLAPVNEDEEADENGVLTYELRRDKAARATPAGPPQTREVTAARFVSDQTLETVRIIRVVAAQNARETRRR